MRLITLSTKAMLSISALLFISACGDSTNKIAGQNNENEEVEAGQVVATVNNQEVTIHELNGELSRIRVNEDTDLQVLKEQTLRALVLRKIFEQKATSSGLDRNPQTLLDIRRSRSAILAQAYLAERQSDRPMVTRSEAEEYVFSNPEIFAERTYYIFDSIVIPSGTISEDQKDEFETIADMDEVEKNLNKLSVKALRRPFTAYSESLHPAMREQLPSLIRDRTIFFVVQGDTETIIRFQESRPAALTGTEAIDRATRILQTRKNREYMANLQSQAWVDANVEFLGDFKEMQAIPETISQDPTGALNAEDKNNEKTEFSNQN